MPSSRKRTIKVGGWLLALTVVLLEIHRTHALLGEPHPTGDRAIFEVNVRMALEGVQRLGPNSQGFYHPGPTFFYWLAVFYRLSGGSTYSLYAGALALTALFVATIAVVVTDRAPPSAAIALLPATFLELRYLGDFPLFDYWPPYVLFLGYACFLTLAAAVAAGGAWSLVPFFAVATLLVQTHVGYAVVVTVATLAALLAGAPRIRKAPRWRAAVSSALLVLAVLWAPPLYAEWFESAGNVARIVRTFGGTVHALPLRALLDRVALEATGPLQYLFFKDSFVVPEAPKHFFAARILLVGELWGLFIAFRRARAREDRFIAALCGMCLLSLGLAVLVLTRVPAPPPPHHTAWISAIGYVSLFAVAGGLLPRRATTVAPEVQRFALAGAFLLTCALCPIATIPEIHRNPEVATLANMVIATGHQLGDRPISVVADAPGGRSEALEWTFGVLLELEKRGLAFSVPPSGAVRWALGRPRWEMETEPDVQITVAPDVPPTTCVEHGENPMMRFPVCVVKVE